MKRLFMVPLAVGLVTACGGASNGSGGSDNGEAGKTASQILNDAATCLRNAQSVHMKANLTSSGQQIAFDLDTQKGGNIAGTLDTGGYNLHLVSVGGQSYFNAGADFWTQVAGADVAAQLADKWVQVPSGTSGAAQITSGVTSLTNYNDFATSLSTATGQATKGSAKNTPDGRAAVTVTKSDGVLYVSTTGSPCPIYVSSTPGSSASGSGYIALTDFNGSVQVTPPPGPVHVPTPAPTS